MTTKHGALSSSAWESGLGFPAERHHTRRPRPVAVGVVAKVRVATLPRTKRGAPPPLEDDIDLLGGLLLVTLFVLIVWL